MGDVFAVKLRRVLSIMFTIELTHPICLVLVRASALIIWPKIFVDKYVKTYCWHRRIANILLCIAVVRDTLCEHAVL